MKTPIKYHQTDKQIKNMNSPNVLFATINKARKKLYQITANVAEATECWLN